MKTSLASGEEGQVIPCCVCREMLCVSRNSDKPARGVGFFERMRFALQSFTDAAPNAATRLP
jgi:hypothetical protein